MKSIISDILHRKKLQIFFLFYMILFLPVLTPLAENLTLTESMAIIAVNTVLFISMAILSVFCSSRSEKIIFSVIFIITYLPSSIYTSYLLFARVLLQKNSVISLFETNPSESREFITNYFSPWIVAGCVAYILVCFLIIWRMKSNKRLKVRDHRSSFYTALIALIIILASPYLSRGVYFADFYKLFVNYKIKLKKEEAVIAQRQSMPYDVRIMEKDSVAKTIVIVIGESLTRTHMSLYGYPRETNPLLTKLGDSLHVYTDVISPQVHTIPVMRSILALPTEDDSENIQTPSLFELFNRAGYETYFISNQPFDGNFSTSYDVLFSLANHKYSLSGERQPDEIVLETLNEILSPVDQKNKLILIHLIGNHMAYEFRYTPSFNLFNHVEDHMIATNTFRDQKATHTIDKYDNSVLYNDFVISSMIDRIKMQQGRESAFVYFSDHGEEVYDIRDFSGHAYEKVTTYMCEIPFLVWTSPDFMRDRSDLIVDTQRAFSTQHFLNSLSNLAGIGYKDYDSTQSLFSKTFVPSERYVGNYTYQEVKAKTKEVAN